MAALSILASVIVLRIHHSDLTTRVPRWLRSLVLRRIASVYDKTALKSDELDAMEPIRTAATATHSAYVIFNEALQYDRGSGRRSETNVLLDDIREHLRSMTAVNCNKKRHGLIRHEWHMLAKALDRALLVIFILVLVSFTATVMFLLPVVY